ncbi:unnamed protein product [Urochloa humidicola]
MNYYFTLWSRWARLQRPTNRGGLGITDLDAFSRALRLRWLWFSWKFPDRPWVGMELPVDEVDHALFAMGTRVTIRDGRTANFWLSSWLDGKAPALLFPSLYKHSKRKKRTVAEALHDDQWIRDTAYDLTVPLLDEYVKLWESIDAVHFDPNNDAADTIVWTRTSHGEYTAKSAYDLQFEGGVFSAFPKFVWKVWAPSRCKFFMWLLLQNRVWTADRLLLREWPNSYFCPLCRRNLETATHLFAECPITTSIWRAIGVWADRSSMNPENWSTTEDLVTWYQGLSGGATDSATKGALSLAILVTWSVWSERNARIFNNQEKTVAKIVDDIKDAARLWCAAGAKHLAVLVVRQFSE